MTGQSHSGCMARHPHHDLIDGYIAYLRARRCSPRTIDGYQRVLERAHDQLPYGLPTASVDELVGWLANPKWSPATQRVYTAAVHSFFVWCVDHQHLSFDPTERVPRPILPERLPRAAADDQVAYILTAAPQPLQTWAAVAALAGARASEVAALDPDRDIIDGHLRIFGKGSRERYVPLHADLARRLDGWHGPLSDVQGQRFATHCWRGFRRIGVETSMHRLRHWFATKLKESGVDILEIKELLGHQSVSTTEIYTRVHPEQLRWAVDQLPYSDGRVDARPGPRRTPTRRRSPTVAHGPGPGRRVYR